MQIVQNSFDNINVDINKLFLNKKNNAKPNHFLKKIFFRFFFIFLHITNLLHFFIDLGLIRSWFYEFRNYWVNILNGRPIFLQDFYFLLSAYRQKFQIVETPDNATKEKFLDSWQNNNTIYLIFSAVRRFSYEPLHCYRFEKYVKNKTKILEYGCGIAPITYSLINYSLKININYFIADIKQINSHYAQYRLPKHVNFIEITPYENCLSDYKNFFDTIFLITVLEHLPDPIEVIMNIHKSLKKNGYLIFDFIMSDGHGQDTIAAVKKRNEIIEFILSNFSVVKGKISAYQNISFAVVKKN
jgi:2-polyprenyl-3-methyl-5-hydroxy-6-metoxy-1,4-benzoquinol methylase